MLLAVDPDPPLATIATSGDPPLAVSGRVSYRPFDGEIFDALVFDVGVSVTGNWSEAGDPPAGLVSIIGDPPTVKCDTGGFHPNDFEASDFDVVYGSFCPEPDPVVAEILEDADPL